MHLLKLGICHKLSILNQTQGIMLSLQTKQTFLQQKRTICLPSSSSDDVGLDHAYCTTEGACLNCFQQEEKITRLQNEMNNLKKKKTLIAVHNKFTKTDSKVRSNTGTICLLSSSSDDVGLDHALCTTEGACLNCFQQEEKITRLQNEINNLKKKKTLIAVHNKFTKTDSKVRSNTGMPNRSALL